MGTAQALLGMGVVSLLVFLWIGAPILLTTWVRNRRREIASRQIALTDALDGALGTIVAPRVKKPFRGPWQIHISVPLAPPSVVGRILTITHEALSAGDPLPRDQYRIILTPRQELTRSGRESRPIQFAARRPSEAIAV